MTSQPGSQVETDSSPRQLMHETFESIRDGIFIVALPEREIRMCNSAAAEMFGYSREALIGSDTRILHVDEESWERFHDKSIGPLEARGHYRGEHVMKRADGSTFASRHSISFVRQGETVEPTHVVSVVGEIGERRHGERSVDTLDRTSSSTVETDDIERALRRERDRFQMVASNIAEVLWMSTPEKSQLIYLNDAFERVWGRPADSILDGSTTWLETIHEEDRERVRAADAHHPKGGYDEKYRIVRPDGEVRWIRERAYPIRRNGEIVRVVGIAQDITQRKRAVKRLRQSEQKFSTAFRMNPLALSIVTADEWKFVDVNESFCELTGYDRSDVLDRHLSELNLWARESERNEVRDRIASGEEIQEFRATLRQADGDVRHVLLSINAIEVDGSPCMLSAMRDVSERTEYERELERRALRDGLTELPNRTLYRNRLEHALERASQRDGEVAVVFMDLIRFQVVNSTLGHAAGDEFLKIVASRLTDCVADHVTVARFGADEFVLMYEDTEDLAEVERRCERVVEHLTEPLEVVGTVVHPEVSVGIARSGPNVENADDMLRYADVALTKAKTEDKTAMSGYDHERDTEFVEKLHRENALRSAVENREFVLRYQPIVNLETGKAVGAEALVRWQHPERGIVSPAEFLELAEETGLIVPIGYQVLEQASRDVAEWLSAFPNDRRNERFRLSVNLSPTQYRATEVVERIQRIARQSNLPLERLVLEITENILVTGEGKMAPLRDRGIRIAIDDFGTGYSSLQYLRRLDADELKIDRSFVREMDRNDRDRALVEGMLDIGRNCGLDVIVEGIETDEQRQLLLDMGATLGQGYHFARPIDADSFATRFLDLD